MQVGLPAGDSGEGADGDGVDGGENRPNLLLFLLTVKSTGSIWIGGQSACKMGTKFIELHNLKVTIS